MTVLAAVDELASVHAFSGYDYEQFFALLGSIWIMDDVRASLGRRHASDPGAGPLRWKVRD